MGCTQLAQGKRYGSARVQSWSYRPVECEFRPVETEFDQLNLKFDGRDIVMFVPLSSIFFLVCCNISSIFGRYKLFYY